MDDSSKEVARYCDYVYFIGNKNICDEIGVFCSRISYNGNKNKKDDRNSQKFITLDHMLSLRKIAPSDVDFIMSFDCCYYFYSRKEAFSRCNFKSMDELEELLSQYNHKKYKNCSKTIMQVEPTFNHKEYLKVLPGKDLANEKATYMKKLRGVTEDMERLGVTVASSSDCHRAQKSVLQESTEAKGSSTKQVVRYIRVANRGIKKLRVVNERMERSGVAVASSSDCHRAQKSVLQESTEAKGSSTEQVVRYKGARKLAFSL